MPLSENRAALHAVQRVAGALIAERSPRDGNPLFLHGPTGTGKTHLTSALLNEVVYQAPDRIVAVLTAGDLNGADYGDIPEAEADLLVIEDVHQLSDRAAAAVATLLDYRAVRDLPTVVTAAVGLRHL